MEWLERLNDAMNYVEENLTDQIVLEEAAKRAACSTFHFQRMFTYIAGVTFSEYVRRRRMTAAALALAEGNAKIIELAAQYGYESPTAFNRAFQSVHGIPPSAAKSTGVMLTAFPRITFTLSIKGEAAMNYKIEKHGPMRIVGFAAKEPMTMEDCLEKVPKFWQKIHAQGGIPRLCALIDSSMPHGILGVSTCDNGGDFSGYYTAVATDQPAPEGMEEYLIPACSWAIFESVGPMPEAIQALQQRIISEWLPNSGYEYASAPDIEVYPDGDQSAANYRSEVWLPIVKK